MRVHMELHTDRVPGASDLWWYFDSRGDGRADLLLHVNRDDASTIFSASLTTAGGDL